MLEVSDADTGADLGEIWCDDAGFVAHDADERVSGTYGSLRAAALHLVGGGGARPVHFRWA